MVGLALVVAGCVAGADGPSPTDPHDFNTTTTLPVTTTTVSVETGLADFRDCMRERGVAMGEVTRDGLGRPRMADALRTVDLSDRSVLDALENCGARLAAGPLDSGSDPELGDLVQQSLQRFAECVRLEGVAEYPDPVRGFDGVGSPFPINRVPWNDPGLPGAVAICRETLAGG